ncbi:PilZ domain-containing protein [Phytopseudomonas dryadis]|uniref:PilZ domain-containing protein n=1 Tax=Phytopseudomonas dryadis TaxID=2487520 RepID=A0A4Q9QZ48_9GAMM|nr:MULTISPECIES: PilZ domain-containing protein [Pseudomonas]TBU89744.1 hypothetical protein DNK44_16470 [Pseudomonas dryadis]TBV05985.1 hypothetical protein DNK34_12225 [Pseudomonas dryadis]TBV18126.1 hypothetical protein DNK41_10475 [Pseudomonas sp. FRB 230]
MRESPLLTPLELEFIQHLNDAPSSRPEPDSGLQVDAATQTTALLANCAAKEQLTIEAHFANQRLSFTPHLVKDEQDTPHLELGVPQIFEEGSLNRAWRLSLEKPLALLDRNGEPSHLRVHEVSMSGLLLEQTADTQPPERFSLDLPLHGQPPITLQGSLIRTTDEGLLAYEINTLDEDSSTRLQKYLYQQHRQLYPQAHRA